MTKHVRTVDEDASIKATVFDYTNANPLAVRLTDTNGDYAAGGGGGGGDGAVVDGVTASIKATVLDYVSSNPLAVRLTDTAGDYVGAGAGTQYTEDAVAAADPTGTVPILVRKDTPAGVASTDGDNVAQRGTNYGAAYVQVVSSAGAFVDTFGGGTQYTEGDTDATITGTAMLMEGATNTLVAAQGTAADGLLVNLGANNDITGTVDLGATDNAVLDAIAASVAGTLTVGSHAVTNAGTFATQVDGAALTALQLIDDTVVAQGTALGTTKNSLIGGSVTTAAPTYTTGQISPLSLDTAGALRVTGGGGGTEYVVDAAAPAAPTGTASLMERDDVLSALTEIEGDWTNMRANANGALWVKNDGTMTVDGSAVTQPVSAASLPLPTGAATAALQTQPGVDIGDVTINNAAGAAAVNVQDGGNSLTVDGSVSVTGTVTVGSHAVTNAGTFATQSAQSGTWTVQPGNTANTTPWLVSQTPATTGGLTMRKTTSAATTNATSVKASAGQVYAIQAFNVNAAVRYLKLYNKASAPTVGTDTPVKTLAIPGNTAGAGFVASWPSGLAFGTGIAFALTTEATDAGTTGVAVNEITVNIDYK